MNLSKNNIFLINLDRSKKRLREAKKHYGKENIEFTRFSAIDGRRLPFEKLFEDNIIKRGRFNEDVWLGTIACAFSHMKIFDIMVKKNIDVALILEDDTKPCNGFMRKLNKYIKDVPEDWNMINLSGALKMREPEGAKGIHIKKNIYKPNKILCTGLAGYLIKKDCAKILLKFLIPLRKEIDLQIRELYDKQLKVYIIYPGLIEQRWDLGYDRIGDSFVNF